MENQQTTSRRVVRQTALNQPPIKLKPEGGYYNWDIKASSGLAHYRAMQLKNQARKDLADQRVKFIVAAWEAQESIPQVKDSKWGVARQLSAFSKAINNPLSADSFVKRYQFWCHLHDAGL